MSVEVCFLCSGKVGILPVLEEVKSKLPLGGGVLDLLLALALGSLMTSSLFFYPRIFAVNKRSLTSYLMRLILLVTLWSITLFFASLFQCRLNFWAIWGSTVDSLNNCIETMELVLAVCIIGVITDIAIICAPIPLVRTNRSRLNAFTANSVS